MPLPVCLSDRRPTLGQPHLTCALLVAAALVAGCGDGADSPSDSGTPSDSGEGGDSGCSTAAQCDDGNDCTDDTCSAGVCRSTPSSTGSACGDGGDACDGAGACVECVDDAMGTNRDSGCSVAAPICSEGACTACTDDTHCEGELSCVDGSCTGCSEDIECDDGLPCTDDSCDLGSGTCTHLAFDERCDDELFCTGMESCAPADDRSDGHGCLAGPPPPRADGLTCTVDTCDEAADDVVHTPNHDACDDENDCTVDMCDASLGCVATPAPEGTLCDGGAGVCAGSACLDCVDSATGTGVDQGCGGGAPFCIGGACVHCLSDDDCGPNQTCDGTGTCVGCTGHADCDDGVSCTVDACDPATTVCVFTPSHTTCDDGVFCNGFEQCSPPSAGADAEGCTPGTAPLIDDGIACTLDSCDEDLGRVLHEPDDGACDDGNECTLDLCRTASGCGSTPHAPGSTCATGVCTDGGTCGVCADDRVGAVDSGCTDETPSCSGGVCVRCEAAGDGCPLDCEGTPDGQATMDACGTCDADPTNNCIAPCMGPDCEECDGTDPSVCDDSNPCTEDSCVAARCVHEPAPRNGDECADASVCSLVSRCDDGVCAPQESLSCSGPCHTGACDPVSGCVASAAGTVCDDGLVETGDDRCLSNGTCTGVCDDGNPCTFDATSSDETGTVCEFTPAPVGVSCDQDADPCTAPVCDGAGACVPQVAPSCADCAVASCTGQCLTGTCTGADGCIPAPEGTACDDGDPRTVDDTCDASGQCAGSCGPRECGEWVIGVDGRCRAFSGAGVGPQCPEPEDPCMRVRCTADARCELVPRDPGDTCAHPCGAGTCSDTGICELTEDQCGEDDSLCWSSACNLASNSCERISDDPGCLFDTAVCDDATRLCDAGVCGDGHCSGRTEQATCPADCLDTCDRATGRSCLSGYLNFNRAGAWRAHQSSAYGWPHADTHQTESLSQMLSDRIRMLHLIIDYCTPGDTSGPLCLCAGDDACGGASIPLEPRLSEILAWMQSNPTVIVSLLLWEYVSDADLRAAFERTGAAELLYQPTSPPGTYEPFPMSVNDMVTKNRRLVVFGGGFLSPQNVLLATAPKRTPTEPDPIVVESPFHIPENNTWECANTRNQTPADIPGFAGTYALVHVASPPSWAGAACYNASWASHGVECQEYAPIDTMFFDFYNSSSDALWSAGIRSPFEDRCLDEVQGCLTDDECDSGICGGLFICLSCESNADCPESQYCDTVFGACLTDQADGALCLSDEACQSGNCDTLCFSCASHSDCESGEWCDAFGGCQPEKSRGFGCVTDYECISGACHAAFCAECNGQEDCGSDDFCNLDILPGESMCIEKTPMSGPCINDFECASGNCHAAVCSGCDAHEDCASTEFCTLDVVPPIESICEPKKNNGSSCGSAVECASAQCTLFTCGECVSDGDCAANEHCDAFNVCAPDVGNNEPCLRNSQCTTGICSAGFCAECLDDGHCSPSENCDAGGDCAPDVPNNAPCLRNSQCTTGICSAGFCAECLNDGHCPASENCDAFGDCAPDVGNNAACLRNAQCTTGICSAGFCAECLNDGHCASNEHCNLVGDCVRSCSNHSDCTSTTYCDLGECAPKVPNGTACLDGVVCLSGCCSFFTCQSC